MTTRLSAAVAEAIAEKRHTELENAARAVIGDREYFKSTELERLTGTPSSTWRYWVLVLPGTRELPARQKASVAADPAHPVAGGPGAGVPARGRLRTVRHELHHCCQRGPASAPPNHPCSRRGGGHRGALLLSISPAPNEPRTRWSPMGGSPPTASRGLRTVRFDLDEIDASLKPSIGQGVES